MGTHRPAQQLQTRHLPHTTRRKDIRRQGTCGFVEEGTVLLELGKNDCTIDSGTCANVILIGVMNRSFFTPVISSLPLGFSNTNGNLDH